MAKHTPEEMEQYAKHHSEAMKHWRSWGSWFSWGSPVGLSIFLLTLAGVIWILAHIF